MTVTGQSALSGGKPAQGTEIPGPSRKISSGRPTNKSNSSRGAGGMAGATLDNSK